MRKLENPLKNSPFFWMIDAPLQELYGYEERQVFHPVHVGYAEAVIGYLSGDTDRLLRAIDALRGIGTETGSKKVQIEARLAQSIAELRLEIRERRVSRRKLVEVMRRVGPRAVAVEHWRGEACSVLGRASEIQGRNGRAMRFYEKARSILEGQGCVRKSVRMLFNRLACKTRKDPEGNYIREYLLVARKARKAGEPGIAGIAMMNVSRELQAAGAFGSALKYANRSLLLMRDEVGSQHHYLAILHRAHLYLDLEMELEARWDLERAKLSAHREVAAAIAHLEARLQGLPSSDSLRIDDLTTGWRARVAMDQGTSVLFGAMEDRLVRILSLGPRSKSQLISQLWERRGDSDSLDFRFKDLIKRIRKKRGDLISFDGAHYRLSDYSYIEVREIRSKSG